MDKEVVEASEDGNQRIAHACQLCREKRVRCSGHRPTCQRCQQQNVDCVYGYARGDSRKSLLAAIEGHNARGDQALPRLDVDAVEHTPAKRLSISTGKRGLEDGDADEDDLDDAASQGTAETQSSITSPILPRGEESTSEASSAKRSSRKQQRRSRISSACLECKKRRRKCTGETPCQTCVTFQTECVYDRSQDRRSKAYFQAKLNAGVREAMESDNIEDVLKLIQNNDHYDLVASELRTALKNAETSKHAADSKASPAAQLGKSPICKHFCALGLEGATPPHWTSPDLRKQQETLLRGPDHLILPYIIPDDSPLSLAFSNFRAAVVHMLEQGTPLATILGPLETEVDLLFRTRRAHDPFTASTWACELARIYAHIDIFTQLANAFLLSRFMRWILDPSVENYILLPDIMKPTRLQRIIPHFASADLYSIPAIRDCLVRGEAKLPSAIGTTTTQGLRFEWPFELDKAVDNVSTPTMLGNTSGTGTVGSPTGTATISRLFAACASDPKYWSCNEDFLENFPEAKGHLNVVDHQHGWEGLDGDREMVDGV